jgi:hypothetical protein
MADCMVLRVIFFQSVVFGMVNCYKLHKNRPGSFFANKPLQRLDKKLCNSSKTFTDPPQADQAKYKHTQLLS